MKADQIHALFAEIMDELAQLKKQSGVKQTAAPIQQAQPVDLSPVLAQIKALEQRLANVRVSVPEKPFKALQEQNLALYEEIKEIRNHSVRQSRLLEQNWQQQWLGWAKETKAFLICLGCLVLSLAVIFFYLGDYWLYKKDHEAMTLLRAFQPEIAAQAIHHIETDSLRDAYLPMARDILAQTDSTQVQASPTETEAE